MLSDGIDLSSAEVERLNSAIQAAALSALALIDFRVTSPRELTTAERTAFSSSPSIRSSRVWRDSKDMSEAGERRALELLYVPVTDAEQVLSCWASWVMTAWRDSSVERCTVSGSPRSRAILPCSWESWPEGRAFGLVPKESKW